jgi:PadR family transcriptional regulator PadR
MAEPMSVLKGTLDVLALKALSWGPMHGFELTRWLESSSGSVLEVDESALYQALYRMESRGLVEAEWGVSENNRRVRLYRMTPAGRAHLRSEVAKWRRYAQTVDGILSAASRGA